MPARVDTRIDAGEHSPNERARRSISGAVFDFVVIPFLVTLILLMIYEIAQQLWMMNGHFL